MKKREIFFTLLCVITLLFSTSCSRKSAEVSDPQEVLSAALEFRNLCLQDYREALARFADSAGITCFESLDRAVLGSINPKVGWSYFLNVSVMTMGNAQGKEPLIAFYNPWCDVFLITAWRTQDGQPKIVDAEMLMGDFVRNQGAPPLVAPLSG